MTVQMKSLREMYEEAVAVLHDRIRRDTAQVDTLLDLIGRESGDGPKPAVATKESAHVADEAPDAPPDGEIYPTLAECIRAIGQRVARERKARDAKRPSARSAIQDHLLEHGQITSVEARLLATSIGLSESSARKALELMLRDGEVERVVTGIYKLRAKPSSVKGGEPAQRGPVGRVTMKAALADIESHVERHGAINSQEITEIADKHGANALTCYGAIGRMVRSGKLVKVRTGEYEVPVPDPDDFPAGPPRGPMAMYVTNHALERYAEHHPTAHNVEDVLRSIRDGQEVGKDVVAAVTQCRRRGLADSTRYVLSQDGRGIFAIAKDTNGVVTYLRLGEEQQAIMRRKP